MPKWFGKNPSRRDRNYNNNRPRRDFYGQNENERDNSQFRRDFYGQHPWEYDQGRAAARNMHRRLSPIEAALLRYQQRWGRFFR
jgi:hypothetical protein